MSLARYRGIAVLLSAITGGLVLGQEIKTTKVAGPVVNGLQLNLSADKTEAIFSKDGKVEKAVALKLTFTNVSDKPIKFNAFDFHFSRIKGEVKAMLADSVKIQRIAPGRKPIFPTIKKLHADTGFRYALDLHCPTLVMEDHQVMYLVGLESRPANNFSNVSVFAERTKSGLPKTAPYAPLVWLKDEASPAAMNSWYFGTRAGVVMAATLEIPFAPPGKATDPASCRRFGRVILQAFVATRFVSGSPKE